MKSELVRRITTTDADDHMPPADSALKLTSMQIELLSRWIEQGAKWQAHWSFIAPKLPALPRVKNVSLLRNPVDDFILACLEREGLQPSPEADRAALIRRVSLDLTGLPQTPADVEPFAHESYERLVDRLLSSPRFGERMTSA